MPKDDRSDWVAVEPEFNFSTKEIRKAQSAYQFFQKHVSSSIKSDLVQQHGKFDIAVFGKAVRERWNALTEQEKRVYEQMAQEDAARFARESHQADVAALERTEKLRKERDRLVEDLERGKRMTRRGLEKKIKKKEKKRNVKQQEESSLSSDSISYGSDSSSTDDATKNKKIRQISQKLLEYRDKKQREKSEKERYVLERQEDLRKDRASQAKRRLEFLLQQSNIFSHFGSVKEDTARYGIKTTVPRTEGSSRRGDTAVDEEEEIKALEEADEHEATFLTSQPSTLGHGQMRPYQLEGLNWMIRLQENGVNGILADEMGLGKTLQSISILVYMAEYQNITGPHLVIVPKSTLSNWMNEFTRWAPTLTAIRFHGDKATREDISKTLLEPAQRDEDREWNVVVTTYEVCNIEKSVLTKFAWTYLVIDEAHRLKNEASALSKTVRMFETKYRILLTGTPLQNSLHELWALLNFLVPDVFESSEQFDEWFNLDIEDKDEKSQLISQLHKILRPFMLRRLKADVEKSLPPKHETILFTGMSKMQKELYRNILLRDIEAIQGNSGSRTAILNIVMQLRKCAGHPYLFPGAEDRTLPPLGEHLVENCGKMVVLDKLLKRLHERGHRVLLFTQMTRILDIMEDYLVMRRFPYCRIDGNTSYEDREQFIDAFNAPNSEKFVFLLSTRAGGLGINLQTADVVILYDSDWNPQADLQAQDRAHRIGQKKPVQVFRLVTEHTIEEKIVERAQQKLKLDAMVVQQGRLKEKDKLSRDELLAAVRFGADKIFKSKDSSITDDDIDMILDFGKRKTQELNEKLQTADKGDLLDFKFDGSSFQTFDGIDYSTSAIEKARADAEMLGIFDIGKRERKEANYNENSLYQQQLSAMSGAHMRTKKKKIIRLPKRLRLPRMEEWQMYDRTALLKIQEEEEVAFKALPEEQQKMATMKHKQPGEEHEKEETGEEIEETSDDVPFVLPPLISEEKQTLKDKLLSEGYSQWNRHHYNAFVKASARFGRNEFEKICLEVGKPENDVRDFASAFWGDLGRERISEHEYDRAIKLIERGEKRLEEIKGLERGTRILVSLFDNPWDELEFTYVNCKDRMFTEEEDRHLLCWTRKYGYGHWQAIRLAIRRNPTFRFNYFLRSLPVEHLARRCEQLMKAAEKEVEHLEKKAREDAGLPTEISEDIKALPPVALPRFRELRNRIRREKREKALAERKQLESTVADLELKIRQVQDRLKELNEGSGIARVSPDRESNEPSPKREKINANDNKTPERELIEGGNAECENGAIGPDGSFVEFPDYDGSEEPVEWKKPFTHFCIRTRKDVKASLDPADRKNKEKIHKRLKERWLDLSDDDKETWRLWSEWDKRRYARDMYIFDQKKAKKNKKHEPAVDEVMFDDDAPHIPKKRKPSAEGPSMPKKSKR